MRKFREVWKTRGGSLILVRGFPWGKTIGIKFLKLSRSSTGRERDESPGQMSVEASRFRAAGNAEGSARSQCGGVQEARGGSTR